MIANVLLAKEVCRRSKETLNASARWYTIMLSHGLLCSDASRGLLAFRDRIPNVGVSGN